MITLCTDYGSSFYTGQVKAAIAAIAPNVPVVDAIDDLPKYQVQASAYLLSALVPYLPHECIVLGVVDPGVGGNRAPVCFKYGSRWFVGPDNGLFSLIVRERAQQVKIFEVPIDNPLEISTTFHGRDVFGPAAARLAAGKLNIPNMPIENSTTVKRAKAWPECIEQVIYIDLFGNAMTGIKADKVDDSCVLTIADNEFARAAKFSDVKTGTGFWYANSIGLVEIAVNKGSAAQMFALDIGSKVALKY